MLNATDAVEFALIYLKFKCRNVSRYPPDEL